MKVSSDSRRFRRRYMAAVTTVATVVVLLLPITNGADRRITDSWFLLRGPRAPTGRVVLVTIDDASFDAIDIRWPWPRTLFAQVLERLTEYDARVVGIDVAMSERGFAPENDRALAASIRAAPPVLLPEKFERTTEAGVERVALVGPIEEFISAGARTGYVNLTEDPDGRVRRLVLFQEHAGAVHLPFSLAMYAAGEGVDAEGALREVPASYGNTFVIPFYGPGRTITRVPFADVLNGTVDGAALQDAYVIIGATFREAHDNAPTPFFDGTPMAGPEIHAHALDAMLGDNLLDAVHPAVNAAILFAVALSAHALFQRLRPAWGAAAAAAAIAALFLVGALLFAAGLVIRVAAPAAVLAVAYVGSVGFHYVVEERRGRYVRSVFSRYVAPAVVGQILADPAGIELGGELREVTLFFSDIRGFTHRSEGRDPAEIVSLLNRYFDAMTEVIFDNGGTVNKFIGDAIMAFYGAPIALADAPERAVRACLAMRERLAALNRDWSTEGADPLRIGMALHTGKVLLGNIGSQRQMEYTVIGDAVNVCSRIESMTKEIGTDLLVSDAVYEHVTGIVDVTTHRDVPIRGRDQTITLHAVEGLSASQS